MELSKKVRDFSHILFYTKNMRKKIFEYFLGGVRKMSQNKKAELAIKELLSRQEYLVTQGNDLAKAFGGLKAFGQQLLDYCFSFVTAESKVSDIYEVSALDIIKH